ncbi:ATP-binding protein [Methylobacterium nodulans]|uniref:Putative transcriptional regulator n=1 Tax=Methylobacterium nodulans (strain LMG 21967 / CNCM I-2342 / ORS 2060) TaxID=460265 RepID=B8IBI1_METNO|nr:ATP-binding protein [Methylobacterium nodulans]ACL57396.1 putative transcriptional regulator [Methylobacterium nodulans ORS 2060]
MPDIFQISYDEALALCSRNEGDLFDHKAAKIEARKVEKIAVAFANSDGGEFVIGIADSKDEPDPAKRWQGAAAPESYNGILQALFNLNPAVDFRHEFLQADKMPGIAMRVYIDKCPNVAKASDGKVYQRVGAQSLPITDPDKITALSFAKGAASYEDTLLNLDPEEIVESREIAAFTRDLAPVTHPLAYCVNEGLVDRKTFAPSCAGVLLFSDRPQPMFPRRCAIKVIFYDTRQEAPEREHLKVNKTVEGPLYRQIHEAARLVTDIMSSISIMTPEGLQRVKYPPEAIWEILVNAVIHRDYSIADDIQIVIYQNRIEIRSPGRLPGFVTTENFLDVRYSRNSKIVRSLAKYKDAPNKDLGEGLNTAFEKMKEWKLKSPTLVEDGNYVLVTIPHTPLASPEELVMEYLQKHPEIKNKQAREITGIKSENQMKEVFYRLRDKGLIELIAGRKGNAAAWQLVPAPVENEASPPVA